MQVEFEDHYVVYVVLLLWLLCCCRGLLETCGSVMHAVDACIDSSCCDVRELLGLHDGSVCAVLLRRAVMVFCFLQPLLLCAVRLAAKQEHLDWHATLRLCSLGALNATAEPASAHVELVEIDFLLLAMPLAVTTSLTCVLFAQWSRTLSGDTAWDAGVSESEEWFCYELSFYTQVAFMNWLLLAVACRDQTVLEVFYAGLALSLVVWFFLAASRFAHESALDHWGSTTAFAVLLLALLPVWDALVRTSCALALAASAVHGLCVLVLVLSHHVASGHSSVAYVCLVRFSVTLCGGAFSMVVLSLGDGVC